MTRLPDMDRNIARCRLVLSVTMLLVVYIDPEVPLLARWVSFASGPFVLDPRLLAVLVAHLLFSVAVFRGAGAAVAWLGVAVPAWIDMLFAAVVATMTTGVGGPAFPLFAFAVAVSGLRGGLRPAALVTTASLVVYVLVLLVSARRGAEVYLMRPVYLAITGYLIGYLGQQRLDLEARARELEIGEQRHRIARDLHDGYAQALAAVTLRLETACRQLRSAAVADALTNLVDLQEGVQHEFEDLRHYARALAGVETSEAVLPDDESLTCASLTARLSGSAQLLDHVLGIAREGIRNIARHAGATTAWIDIQTDSAGVRIHIVDDGHGLPQASAPWSIASRAREIGADLQVLADPGAGAHLLITVPHG
jgi:signal transduction histidine kinase